MIQTLQDRLEALIEAHAWFDGVPVVTEKKGDIQNQIDNSIGKLGFIVVIITPEGTLRQSEGGKLRMEHTIGVSAVESVLLNATQPKHAKDAVPYIIEAIHDQWNGLGNQNSRGRANRIEARGYQSIPDPDGLTVYQVAAITTTTLTATD